MVDVNKLFLRAFGFLMLSILVTFLVCLVVARMVNVVRDVDYKTQQISPVFQWLASSDSGQLFDSSRSLLNDFSLRRTPLSEISLSSLDVERLHFGQVVVTDQQDGSTRVDVISGKDEVLTASFTNFYQDTARLTERIITLFLLNKPESQRRRLLGQLSTQFHVKVTLLGAKNNHLPQSILNSLAVKHRAVYWPDVSKPSQHYVRLPDGLVYRIDFPEPFSAMAWPVVLVLLFISIASLAATVFILLSTIDQRLKRLQTVATRISRGELDARIRVEQGDAIGRLGEAFNSMAEHIERLVGVQKEMIHAVSHELRTPVARIRFGVQMIEDCPTPDAMEKQLKGIDGDIQELDELIDEILTYARLEQGGPVLSFHNTDIHAVVEQVVFEQSAVRPETSIMAVFSTGSDAWRMSEVDERYIHRSVQNLVGNATRYAKSKVRVVCHFDEETCRVDVEDDGPGIPEENWESVFTPFARLDDSRTRSSGGYGLGLSIVRRILYWHGGQAFLGRSEMGGAKFSLVWPRIQSLKVEIQDK